MTRPSAALPTRTVIPYVPIIRQFRDAAENVRAPHERRFWRSFPQRSRPIVWEELCPVAGQTAVILLAPSGSGKSTEFEQQAQRLRSSGRRAVYCAAADVAEFGFDEALSAQEADAFTAWRASTETLTLFVDAVDELYLRQRTIRDVLRRLEKIDLATRNAQLVFSARNGSWSTDDTGHLKTFLRRIGPEDDPKPRIVTFEPIDHAALRALVDASGIPDVDGFLSAFDADELDGLVDLRPCDVSLLVDYWKSGRGFGRWTDILEGFINASFDDPSRTRDRNQALTTADGRQALRRLAAASALMKVPHIGLPAHAAPLAAINSRRLFDDWTAGKLVELFENPLFIHKGTDAVQLPQGALTHYLCARWIADRADNGWSTETLVDALFVKVFDDDRIHIPDAKRAVAGWVAPQVEAIRTTLIAYHPQVLLYEGDPARLEDGDVRTALTQLMKVIAAHGNDPMPTRATLKRLGRPAFEPHVCSLLRENSSVPAAQRHLLRFAEIAGYKSCLPDAKALALDRAIDSAVRCAAISLVGALGEAADKDDLKTLITEDDAHVRAELLKALVPGTLAGDELTTFLSAGGEHEFRYLLAQIASRIPSSDIDATLSAIRPTLVADDERSERSFEVAVPLAIERIRRGGGPFSAEMAQSLLQIERLSDRPSDSDYYLGIEERRKLDDVLSVNDTLRRDLWALRFRAAAEDAAMFSHLSNPRFGDLREDDLEWLHAQEAGDGEWNGHLRFVFERIYSNIPEERQREYRRRAGLSSDLISRLERIEQYRRDLDSRRTANDEQRSAAEAETVRNNQAALRERRTGIETGEDLHALCWAWQHLDDTEGASRARARLNVASLRALVGDELVGSFIVGFKACWRRQDVPLRDPGNNSIPVAILAGLTGLTLEVQDRLDLRMLAPSEADLAARYALYELNNFPFWFDDLIAAHRGVVLDVLRRTVAAEWDYSEEHHGVLRFASYASQRARALMREVVLELFELRPPGHLRTLNYAIDALLTSTADVKTIDDIVARGIATSGASNDLLAEWLRAWIHFSPTAAADWCERLRSEDASRFGEVVEKAAGLVEEDLDERLGRVAASSLLAPLALERWIRLLYLGIRPEDDRRRESGRAYNVTTRDHAERLRYRCLTRLSADPSEQAHAALQRLVGDPLLRSYVEQFERALEAQVFQAVQYSDPMWSEEQILRVENGDEKQPTTLTELFALVRTHIRSVGALIENDDFSYRDMFRTDTPETEIQLWFASTLKQRSQPLYSIVRENVVDNKKEVDISAFADGIGYVPIEIKPLGPYSQLALERVIEKQLLGQYMRPVDRPFGILLLVRRDPKTWTINGKRTADLGTLVEALQRYATTVGAKYGKVIRVEAIDLRSGFDGVKATRAKAKASRKRASKKDARGKKKARAKAGGGSG